MFKIGQPEAGLFCTVPHMADLTLATKHLKQAAQAREYAKRVLDPNIRHGLLKLAEEHERKAEVALR
jgi:hypothetical protein